MWNFLGAARAATLQLMLLVLLALAGVLSAAQAQTPPPSGGASQPGGGAAPTSLSPADVAKVKSILAPFKPATLTAGDAKFLKRSLRDAGFRRSPALDAVLVQAGFSPAKLDQLDPPPAK